MLLAGLAIIAIGCTSNRPDPIETVQSAPVLDPNAKAAPSQTLRDFCAKFDAVFDSDMAPTDAKIAPVAKTLLSSIEKKADTKALITKNRKLLVEGIEAAKQALINLSRSTSHGVDPLEHDKYVAYYTAVGERMGTRRDEYQAFLDYGAEPSEDNRIAVLESAQNVAAMDAKHKLLLKQ
jgi:hypothetical protein